MSARDELLSHVSDLLNYHLPEPTRQDLDAYLDAYRAEVLRESADVADRFMERFPTLEAPKAVGIIGPHTTAGAIGEELRRMADGTAAEADKHQPNRAAGEEITPATLATHDLADEEGIVGISVDSPTTITVQVRPHDYPSWCAWCDRFDVDVASLTNRGNSITTARGTAPSGVTVNLVGHGVPALLAAQMRDQGGDGRG